MPKSMYRKSGKMMSAKPSPKSTSVNPCKGMGKAQGIKLSYKGKKV